MVQKTGLGSIGFAYDQIYRKSPFFGNIRANYTLLAGITRPLCKGKLLLEVGCGSGALAFLNAGSAKSVEAFDISKQAIENAKRIQKILGLKNIRFQTGDAQSIGFSKESFDVVLHSEVLEHLQEPEAGLREAARVLKKQGFLVLSTPNECNPKGCFKTFLERRGLRMAIQPLDKPMKPSRIIKLASDSGLRLEKTLGFNFRKAWFLSGNRDFAAKLVMALPEGIKRSLRGFPAPVQSLLFPKSSESNTINSRSVGNYLRQRENVFSLEDYPFSLLAAQVIFVFRKQ